MLHIHNTTTKYEEKLSKIRGNEYKDCNYMQVNEIINQLLAICINYPYINEGVFQFIYL